MAAVTTGVAVAGCSSGSDTSTSGGDGGDGGDGDDRTSGGDGGSGESWEQASTVDMTDELGYEPKRIEVEAGTTVTWKNTGNVGHTITAYEDEIPDDAEYWASGGFDSQQAAVDGYNGNQEGNVEAGDSWEYTFETTGTHEYYCVPHEMNGMVGYVKVV